MASCFSAIHKYIVLVFVPGLCNTADEQTGVSYFQLDFVYELGQQRIAEGGRATTVFVLCS